MKTLTAAKARQNLTKHLRRALEGENIGIVCDGRIVALRPVQVRNKDYVLQEYGVTEQEVSKALDGADREIARDHRKGLLKPFKPKVVKPAA